MREVEPRPVLQSAHKQPATAQIQGQKRNHGRIIGVIATLVVILLLFYILLFSTLGYILWGKLGVGTALESEFTIEREITLTSDYVLNYTLTLPIPKNTDGQNIKSVSTNPAAQELQRTGYPADDRFAMWEGTMDTRLTFTITYRGQSSALEYNVDSSDGVDSTDVQFAQLKAHYLGTEWQIDPDAPGIRGLAENVTAQKTSVLSKLRALYDYVLSEVDYGRNPSAVPNAPLKTLRDGVGDCDDMSILYASMSRSIGIPSWLELGMLYESTSNEWEGHGWIRSYIPDSDSGGKYVEVDLANKQWLKKDASHLMTWEADGNGTHLQEVYEILKYSYMGSAPNLNMFDEAKSISFESVNTILSFDNTVEAAVARRCA